MKSVATGVCALAFILLSGCANDPVRIDVGEQSLGAPMRGWEVSAEMLASPNDLASYPAYRDIVLDKAVDEVGVNRVRVHVQSGIENTNRAYQRYWDQQISYQAFRPLRYVTVNDDADPHHINWAGFDFKRLDDQIEQSVLPMKARLQARGERLFLNVCYVAFTNQITSGAYDHADPEEYAEFVLATYLHLKEVYGLTPDAWEVILEPDNHNAYWSSGRQVAVAMLAAARRLREAGFTPHFIVPSTMNLEAASRYLDEMAAVPGAFDDVVEISYHRYEGVSPAALASLKSRALAHGLPLSMLEYWFGYGTPGVLYEDLAEGDVVAWQGRTLKGLFEVETPQQGPPQVRPKPDIRQNLQIFKAVRLDARRLHATSSDPEQFKPLAWRNRDGSQTLVILADRAGDLQIGGLSEGKYAFSVALPTLTAEDERTLQVRAGQALKVQMPGPGVATLTSYRPATRPASNVVSSARDAES